MIEMKKLRVYSELLRSCSMILMRAQRLIKARKLSLFFMFCLFFSVLLFLFSLSYFYPFGFFFFSKHSSCYSRCSKEKFVVVALPQLSVTSWPFLMPSDHFACHEPSSYNASTKIFTSG